MIFEAMILGTTTTTSSNSDDDDVLIAETIPAAAPQPHTPASSSFYSRCLISLIHRWRVLKPNKIISFFVLIAMVSAISMYRSSFLISVMTAHSDEAAGDELPLFPRVDHYYQHQSVEETVLEPHSSPNNN